MRKLLSIIAAALLAAPAYAASVTYEIDQHFSNSTSVYGLQPSNAGPHLTGFITFDTDTRTITDYALTSRVRPSYPNTTWVDTEYTSANGTAEFTHQTVLGFTPVSGTTQNHTLDYVTFTHFYGPQTTVMGVTNPLYKAQLGLSFYDLDLFGPTLEFHQGETINKWQVVTQYQYGDLIPVPGYALVNNNPTTDGINNGGTAGAQLLQTPVQTPAVPLPAGLPLMLGAFGLAGLLTRRKTA